MSAHIFLLFSSLLFLHLYWFVIFYTTTTNSQSQWLSPVPTFSRSFLVCNILSLFFFLFLWYCLWFPQVALVAFKPLGFFFLRLQILTLRPFSYHSPSSWCLPWAWLQLWPAHQRSVDLLGLVPWYHPRPLHYLQILSGGKEMSTTNLGYPWRWHSFILSATALTGLPFTLPLLFWFSLCFIFSLGRLVVWPFVLCNNSNEH